MGKNEYSIEDKRYKAFAKAYQYAMDMTKKECNQAVEGMYANLNTLQSRSGNQLPFTSVNYGTDTSAEGRMVTKALLENSLKGGGALHKTHIFPCGIFQYKKGVNDKEGTPNYDLKQLAIESTAKRLYPNYANCDWVAQENWIKADRDLKQQVLKDVLVSEHMDLKFKQNLKDNPKAAKLLGFKTAFVGPGEADIVVDMEASPVEVFSTMGKCKL